ncbi:MAG: RHS repeat domain-containing protein, partial [Anaerolineae bacterium]
AVRVNGTLYFLHGDHLGSATVATDASGNRVGELRYTPYGVTRYEWGNVPTARRYTGQPWEGVGLYDYGARMYSPGLGRFISADVLVPNPAAPQLLNRYAYVRNSPLVYVDERGHVPLVPLLIAGGLVVLKVVDYGWTAYDVYQSGRTLANPLATDEDKLIAGFNIVLSVGLEVAEPEDWLPASLPLDDLARRGVVAGLREAIQQGGLKAGVAFLRETTGEAAPQILRHLYEQGLFRSIRSAGEWEAILKGLRQEASLEVHHLIEQRFAKRVFGVKPEDVPAVVLDRTFHQKEVTARLFSRLPTNRAKFEPQEIWNVYKDVYGALGHEDWLEAIWPYFARLGVQR